MTAPDLCKCTRCTRHIVRCIRSYRGAFMEIVLQLTIAIRSSLQLAANEPRPMTNCVTGLPSWRPCGTCKVPRIVALGMWVCEPGLVRSTKVLPRWRAPSPIPHHTLPPRRLFLVANCRGSRFPYGPKRPINLSDAGGRLRAAWGMWQTTRKTMHAASCLWSSAWPTHFHVSVYMCVCGRHVSALLQLTTAGCVALSGAAGEIDNLLARSRGAYLRLQWILLSHNSSAATTTTARRALALCTAFIRNHMRQII